MTAHLIRFLVALLALSAATVGQAQSNDWYVAPSLVWTDDDEYRAVDDAVGGQIAVGRDMTEHLSLEGLLGYTAF